MSTMGIAIGATALSLILVVIWLISLSLRKQRLEQERKAREVAYRKAIEKARLQEKKDRLFKAETGHIPSVLYLAKEAERTNIKEALYWYEKAAQQDNVNGMYGIVRLSMKRKEDLILREQANFWQLAIAALDNDADAKFNMGQALIHGRGTTKNIPKGYALIEEAATSGHTDAMLFMGDWCLDKDNSDYSPENAVEWFRMAADKHDLNGKIKLGLSYLNGLGVEKNHGQGCYWLERAAEKNNTEAMFHAGEAWIDHGEHGNAIAYIWLFLSAHFGYEPAKAQRDKVGANLGVDSIVGLQALTKPIMTKLSQEAVTKHSVIKALNKLYKRKVPVPKKTEEGVEVMPEEAVEDVALEQPAKEVSDYTQVPFDASTNKPSDGSAGLDFSQSTVQPNWKS